MPFLYIAKTPCCQLNTTWLIAGPMDKKGIHREIKLSALALANYVRAPLIAGHGIKMSMATRMSLFSA
jgi:hypothetical protein